MLRASRRGLDSCRAFLLTSSFKKYGHVECKLDPLDFQKPIKSAHLDPSRYGLKTSDTVQTNQIGIKSLNTKEVAIGDLVEHLRAAYCGSIGAQFVHLESQAQQDWISEQLEQNTTLPKEQKLAAFRHILESEVFDHFLASKFTSLKRYGGEGLESLMAAVDESFRQYSAYGVEKVVIGMAHRGRLPLCVNVLQYPAEALFKQIQGGAPFEVKSLEEYRLYCGDVISHIAPTASLEYNGKSLSVSMLPNPSHLEAVNPVAAGKTRARMDDGQPTACLLIHGDSAVTGQGLNQELMTMSYTKNFNVGGIVHIISNNQIGYTTQRDHGRSTTHAGDIFRALGAPIFIVNADDPEAVVKATKIAVEFQQKFKRDAVVEILGYRRHGHNELDQPAFTQPTFYKKIAQHPSVVTLYGDRLVEEGLVTKEEITEMKTNFRNELNTKLKATPSSAPLQGTFGSRWSSMEHGIDTAHSPDTGVDGYTLRRVAEASVTLPDGFNVHHTLTKSFIDARLNAVKAGKGIDWATAETMAVGSLLAEGKSVRMSGQDVPRGTFSQRHWVLWDSQTGADICPLNESKLNKDGQGRLYPVPSPLSEFAVMLYEYGYSWDSPNNLCIWEAQFGDFFNGAQIAIDNFIASGEAKWQRQSALTLLLPHGFDGTGPEHSSCRYERFLQLCNWNVAPNLLMQNTNLIVAFPTTPANYFHLLRRQIVRPFRKPLIVVGPKTLLRDPQAVSEIADMEPGTTFQPVLQDPEHPAGADPSPEVDTVVLVSGKFYYELARERKKRGLDKKILLLRVEELCPFPFRQVIDSVLPYVKRRDGKPNANLVWAQEEHLNMGGFAWADQMLGLYTHLPPLQFVGRPPAVCATGLKKPHVQELERVFIDLFSSEAPNLYTSSEKPTGNTCDDFDARRVSEPLISTRAYQRWKL